MSGVSRKTRLENYLRATSLLTDNDNAAPRAKVLEFRLPQPGIQVLATIRLPQDIKDRLCEEAGYTLAVTDPIALTLASIRFHEMVSRLATAAIIRSARKTHRDDQ